MTDPDVRGSGELCYELPPDAGYDLTLWPCATKVCAREPGATFGTCQSTCTPSADGPVSVGACIVGTRCVRDRPDAGTGTCRSDCRRNSNCSPGTVCGPQGYCVPPPHANDVMPSGAVGGASDCTACAEERCGFELAACQLEPRCMELLACQARCTDPWNCSCSGGLGSRMQQPLRACLFAKCFHLSFDSRPDGTRLYCSQWCGLNGETCPEAAECRLKGVSTADCGTGAFTCTSYPVNGGACSGGECVDGACEACANYGDDCTPSGSCERQEISCASGTPRCTRTGQSAGAVPCTLSDGRAGNCSGLACRWVGEPVGGGGGGAGGGTGAGGGSGGGAPVNCPNAATTASITTQPSGSWCSGQSRYWLRVTNQTSTALYCKVCPTQNGTIDRSRCTSPFNSSSSIAANASYGGSSGDAWTWCASNTTGHTRYCVPLANTACVDAVKYNWPP